MRDSIRFIALFCIGILLKQCDTSNIGSQTPHHAYTNALADQSSPYLLQHAHNPVNWYPWNDVALEKAKNEDKLMIISVGYAACHWCHVMEHESFEDTTVSALMNEHFVSIKVDREERPDVDDVYMTACQMISQKSCGWPLNAITLPNGKPVWAGTYFPKKEWIKILEYFVEVRKNEPEKLVEYAENVASGIQNSGKIQPIENDLPFEPAQLEEIQQAFLSKMDMKNGGRVGAPKFPMPSNYLFLMQTAFLNDDVQARKAVITTLDKMANGGIYDHLGGGFARYSTDGAWHVPHFEKMLYDNGQLISLYANAYKWTKDPKYLEVVRETIRFANRELKDPAGAYYSSLDADSEGEEGKFYVWTKEEIGEVLGETAADSPFYRYYDISQAGNWENGKNILRIQHSLEDVAKKSNLMIEDCLTQIARDKQKLFDARASRIRPGLDDKVLTAWNALMISGLVDAFEATGDEAFLDQAIQTSTFIESKMMETDGRLSRNYKDGNVTINGFLDDYALTIEAFIKMYEVTFDEKWLGGANKLASYVLAHFLDAQSQMFYYTSDLDPALIARKMESGDNVIPGSNSTMAHNLLRLGLFYYNQEFLAQSTKMLQNLLPQILESGQPQFYSNWCRLLTDQIRRPYEVAIVGPEAKSLSHEFLSFYHPQKIVLGGKDEGTLELLKEKLQGDKTYIYVCQDKVCKYPVTTVKEALSLME
jgi:uncharacterized protein YyaL (SSP411 family)